MKNFISYTDDSELNEIFQAIADETCYYYNILRPIQDTRCTFIFNKSNRYNHTDLNILFNYTNLN